MLRKLTLCSITLRNFGPGPTIKGSYFLDIHKHQLTSMEYILIGWKVGKLAHVRQIAESADFGRT